MGYSLTSFQRMRHSPHNIHHHSNFDFTTFIGFFNPTLYIVSIEVLG
jgi:hypothetical protein